MYNIFIRRGVVVGRDIISSGSKTKSYVVIMKRMFCYVLFENISLL